MSVIEFPSRRVLDQIASDRIAVGVEYSRAKTDSARLAALVKFNQLRIRQAIFDGVKDEPR